MNCVVKYINPDFFKGKTLLELGCGYADIGNMFSKLGALVTSSDARKEHLSITNTRHPHIKTLVLDADKDTIPEFYDIIVHWGLLYHIKEVEKNLKDVLSKCNILLLETEVMDSTNHSILNTIEDGFDQAYNMVGSRPSQKYVEKILKDNGFKFINIRDPILNSDFHKYDWEESNTMEWKHGLRRFWICWKSDCNY